jgi:general secretion pathway protein H
VTRCAAAAKCARGFTLIELLIVLLIMGLLVGLVSVIVRPDDRGILRVEAERLAQLLELATAESRLAGQPLAWTADGTGYRFWRMTGDAEWSEVRDSDLLRARSLPQGMMISGLQVENAPAGGAMRLEFSAHGLTPAFIMQMTLGAVRCAVAASPVGEIRVTADDGVSSCGSAAP